MVTKIETFFDIDSGRVCEDVLYLKPGQGTVAPTVALETDSGLLTFVTPVYIKCVTPERTTIKASEELKVLWENEESIELLGGIEFEDGTDGIKTTRITNLHGADVIGDKII